MKDFTLGMLTPFVVAFLAVAALALARLTWAALMTVRDKLMQRIHKVRPITVDMTWGDTSEREAAHKLAATLLAGGRLRIVKLPGTRVMLFVDDWRPADMQPDDATPTVPDTLEESAARELARHGRGDDLSHCKCGEYTLDLNRHIARHVLYAAMRSDGKETA